MRDTNAAMSDRNAVMLETNAALLDTNVPMDDTNVAMLAANLTVDQAKVAPHDTSAAEHDSNAAVQDTNAAMSDTNVAMYDTNVALLAANLIGWSGERRTSQHERRSTGQQRGCAGHERGFTRHERDCTRHERRSDDRNALPRATKTGEQRRNPRDCPEEFRVISCPTTDGPEEQAMGWYYYLENTLRFPFAARCRVARAISPLQPGEQALIIGMAPEEECAHEMFVLTRWQHRALAVPLAQLDVRGVRAVDATTRQAVADWHYWLQQGYEF